MFASEKDIPQAEKPGTNGKAALGKLEKILDMVSPSVANSIYMSTTATILTLSSPSARPTTSPAAGPHVRLLLERHLILMMMR